MQAVTRAAVAATAALLALTGPPAASTGILPCSHPTPARARLCELATARVVGNPLARFRNPTLVHELAQHPERLRAILRRLGVRP